METYPTRLRKWTRAEYERLIYADTHVIAWLYASRPDLIPLREG